MQPTKVYRGRWIDSPYTLNATEVFYEFTSAAQAEHIDRDGPTAFTFAVYQMRAFAKVIPGDGDHAIKTRVFRFLFRRPYPWYVRPKDVFLVVSQTGVSDERAAQELVNVDGDVVNAILGLT